jgi:hypothetical protein
MMCVVAGSQIKRSTMLIKIFPQTGNTTIMLKNYVAFCMTNQLSNKKIQATSLTVFFP